MCVCVFIRCPFRVCQSLLHFPTVDWQLQQLKYSRGRKKGNGGLAINLAEPDSVLYGDESASRLSISSSLMSCNRQITGDIPRLDFLNETDYTSKVLTTLKPNLRLKLYWLTQL